MKIFLPFNGSLLKFKSIVIAQENRTRRIYLFEQVVEAMAENHQI